MLTAVLLYSALVWLLMPAQLKPTVTPALVTGGCYNGGKCLVRLRGRFQTPETQGSEKLLEVTSSVHRENTVHSKENITNEVGNVVGCEFTAFQVVSSPKYMFSLC